MKRKILITGLDSELKTNIVQRFLDNDIAVAVSINSQKGKTKTKTSNLIEIPWNNRSPLSAKNLVLECQNKLGDFNETLSILSSDQSNKPIHEISSSDIENSIDTGLKGNIFILKEIILYFQKKGNGTISLIQNNDHTEFLAPLYAIEKGSISSLIQSLFASYQNEQLTFNSFSSNSLEIKEYSEFIFKNISEHGKSTHGKNFKFQERGMLKSFTMTKKR